MSESVEMYLITVARLRRAHQPVPLALLAQALEISPVSANEMCRRLAERALVEYQPYKGVTLTEWGETLARRVLGRRHLWEVFLVDRLGLAPTDADEIACRLEHVTPDALADRLAAFLAFPSHSPQGEPIPYDDRPESAPRHEPLASLPAGAVGRIITVHAEDASVRSFLHANGLAPGAVVTVLAVTVDELLIAVGRRTIALALAVAADVLIAPLERATPDTLADDTSG